MKSCFKGLGLMSGTSLDGLDLAYCQFEKSNGIWRYELLNTLTFEYPKELYNRLANSKGINSEKLQKLDTDYGHWMGQACYDFIRKEKISPEFIASHGYTVFHQPQNNFTLQIGNGFETYKKVQIPVIHNFRQMDVALGGQGAPLVPIGDLLLFREFKFCLNLGGFANISIKENNRITAGDISPFNLVLNSLSQVLGQAFDDGGAISKSGSIDKDLLQQLNGLTYYEESFPKSLGAEWVDTYITPMLLDCVCSIKDQMATMVHHVAFQTAKLINSLDLQTKEQVLCTGGGTFNHFFISTLKNYLHEHIELVIPDRNLIEFKEAMIFAFLGVLKLRNEVNTLASVTGATRDSCGGLVVQE